MTLTATIFLANRHGAIKKTTGLSEPTKLSLRPVCPGHWMIPYRQWARRFFIQHATPAIKIRLAILLLVIQ